jgi:NAD(P)-dependent dehydrogenase (short-subunit alcohol dehydrogenase family)
MDLQLKDKVIVVTGGANGIGAAIVRAAAHENACPLVVDRDQQSAEKLVAELHQKKVQAHFIPADLTRHESCAAAVKSTLEHFGRLDALVNCAGINDRVGLEHGSPEEYVHSLERNLLHCYNMAHYALPALKQSGGCIVNIASKTALTGQGGTSGYASSKGAVLALTREWAAELLPYGIRVNAVVPAEVMTPMYQRWVSSFPNPDEKLRNIVSKIPLGKRMTAPEEIAATVLFLISPIAGHIHGQHIFVDGGYVHLDRALT